MDTVTPLHRLLASFLAITLLAAVAAPAQVPWEGGDAVSFTKDPPAAGARPKVAREAGNGIYRIWVADGSAGDCGAWTAATGPDHPASALFPPGRKNVLYNGQVANPGTSDTTLRSYSSNRHYRTGPNASRDGDRDCRQICDWAESSTLEAIEVELPDGAIRRTGWRYTWRIRDGSGGPTIELVQIVNVEGPLDGSESVANTVIRETHVVRNVGPGNFRFGLRKHWDWQIDSDDGPAFGDCETPDEACDRSMDLTPDGTLSGLYPSSYTINHDPATHSCPPGIRPLQSGCGGDPLYLVAGTVSPPSALDPPPDAPELLQFNNWDVVVNSCWWPRLIDAAPCGALGNAAGDDTTIAYFYGLTAASAIQLGPGQERSFTQYVVADEEDCPSIIEPPTLSCDAGGPYEADCEGERTSVPLDGEGSSDSGSPPLYSWTTDCPGGAFDDPAAEDPVLTLLSEGCVTRCEVTLTVTDAEDPGASLSCSSTVTLVDSTPPQLSCPPEPLVVECEDGGLRRDDPLVRAWLASAAAFDDCQGGATQVEDDLPSFVPLDSCPTDVTVTFRTVDACGNEARCTQLLRLIDTQPPTLACPEDRSFECGEPVGDQEAWRASASAEDGCGGALAVAGELLTTERPCPTSAIETWLFSSVDSCGNRSECTAVWSVGDTSPPSLVGLPEDLVIECPETPPAPPAVGATDSCDPEPVVTFSEERRDGACPQEYRLLRTWTARDACGNETQATRTVDVVDTTPPQLTAPADRTEECAPSDNFLQEREWRESASAVDACGPATLFSRELSRMRLCGLSYQTTWSFWAVDACGNESERAQATFRTEDTIAPEVVPPEPLEAECPGPSMGDWRAGVRCAGEVCSGCDTIQGPCRVLEDCGDATAWECEFWGIDGCGNRSETRTSIFRLVDTTPPTISGVPPNAVVECDAVPPPAEPTASDSCGRASLAFDELRTDGPCPHEYLLTRTWTATDECGNSAAESQTISVVDTAPPTISGVPADAVVECDAVPPPAEPTASDTCGSATLAFDELRTDGSCPHEYLLTRTWTATDECGNSAAESQTISVVDTAPPTISGVPADAVVECDAVPPPAEPAASDTCGRASLAFDELRTDGSCPHEYSLTRTWTATDECGNSAAESQTISVVDTAPPTISGVPADAVVECDAVPPPAEPTASDSCGAATLAFDELRTDGPCPHEYLLTRTWTATDECGNASALSQSISVVDTRPPELTVPEPLVLECTGPEGVSRDDPRVQAWLARARAHDACSGPIAPSHDAPELFPLGCPQPTEVPVEFRAVDECGRVATAFSSVTVVDTTPPVIESVDLPGCLWPPNHRYVCFEDLAARVLASDNCSAIGVRFSGCASDQPDEAPEEGDRGGREEGNGDGHSFDDCVVAPDGSAACLRSERQGTDPEGRHYLLNIEVFDACGNVAELPWSVHVPHDQSEHDCEKLDVKSMLKKHDPFPWER